MSKRTSTHDLHRRAGGQESISDKAEPKPYPAEARRRDAEVACLPAPDNPAETYFLEYEPTRVPEHVYSYLTQGTKWPVGTRLCSPSRGSVDRETVTTGSLRCYGIDGDEKGYLWTDLHLGVMGVSADSLMTFGKLSTWHTLETQRRQP